MEATAASDTALSEYMTREETAAYIGVSTGTLAAWAAGGKGPVPHRVHWSSRIFYRVQDVKAFVATGAREAPDTPKAPISITLPVDIRQDNCSGSEDHFREALKERCPGCRFWGEEGPMPGFPESEGIKIGSCVRMPPMVIGRLLGEKAHEGFDPAVTLRASYFPVTSSVSWCGEWMPRLGDGQ